MTTDPVASVSPGVPPLQQAARGLGLIFVATAFGCLTYIAQLVLRGLDIDWHWRLIPLAVWGLLQLMLFRGCWLCRRAKASLKTKSLLRTLLTITAVAAFLELAVAIFLTLLTFQVFEIDEVMNAIPSWVRQEADLAGPLLWLASVLFLFYVLRGLALALELYEFATDALAILVEALMIFLILPPCIALLIFVFYYANVLTQESLRQILTVPGTMLPVLLLGIYPFVRFCNLLTGFRDAMLRRLQTEQTEKHRHKYHPG